MNFEISARRIDQHGSVASCKQAELVIDTDLNGRADAFNPAELLLAAVAACILKNIERVSPMIHLEFRGVSVKVKGERQDAPAKMSEIQYQIIMDTDDTERKLNLLHDNIKKFGTVYNTISPGTELTGEIHRSQS